ncbi:uncharacterized protein LOC122249490 [Penaeus japonicus]|uniref:uncharacterized protein LOC122249490 n=1 Tax=Penaeus japonicus TaxID=27405 RepID=UPI001C71177E|nr:uncharacterized protein LOC122249490 [Penaeus japonicus]
MESMSQPYGGKMADSGTVTTGRYHPPVSGLYSAMSLPSQRPGSGMSDGESSRGDSTPQPPGLSLPGGSSPTPKTAPAHRSPAPGPGSPTGKRKASVTSSVASGASLASLLTKLHQPPSTSLSLEGKLKVRATLDCGSDVLSCKFSPDGATIGVALRSGQVRFFTQAGALSHTLQIAESEGEAAAPATSLIWMPGGQPDAVLATCECGWAGGVLVWAERGCGVQGWGRGRESGTRWRAGQPGRDLHSKSGQY